MRPVRAVSAVIPPDPEVYAAWAGAVAERYGDRITYFQIWHNPNLADSWGGKADPGDYTAMLAAAADAIRAAEPGARIVLGSLAPTVEVGGTDGGPAEGQLNYAEDLFLDLLYDAGAGPYFDVVAAQPYGFFTGPDDRYVSQDTLNFSRVILIREALVAHGDAGKAVWAADFGWNSKPADWPGPTSIWGSVDETTQAQYTAEALARVDREWPWMGLMCINGLQPRPAGPALAEGVVPDAEENWGFALIGPPAPGTGSHGVGPGEPRPVYDAVRAWATQPAVAGVGVTRADTSLAEFEGAWTLGPQGADIGTSGDRVRLTFDGTDVALTVRRGAYRAFLFVTVDGKPAPALPRDREGRAYVVLYDPASSVVTVPLATGLAPGQHTVEVVADRGWGQWALADWRVFDAPPGRAAVGWGYGVFGALAAVGLVVGGWSGRRTDWGTVGQAVRGAWGRLAEWVRVAVSLLVTAITLFAAWQTLTGDGIYRRLGDYGQVAALALSTGFFYLSPWFLLTLVAGAVMSVLVFLSPSLGLALTMVAAPLYLHPLSLFGKSFSLAELVLLPTLVGWLVQWLGGRGAGERSGRDAANRAGQAARGPTDRADRDDGVRAVAVDWRRLRVFFWPVLAFILMAVVSSFAAQHQREAFRELRLVIVEPALFFVALATMRMTARERWRIVDGWVLSALVVAVVGLVQYFLLGDVITAEGGIARLRSLYGSPNNVGLYLGRVLPVLLAIVLWAGPQTKVNGGVRAEIRSWATSIVRGPRRLGYLVAMVPVGLALLLSLSRGAILLGVPGALLALGWLAGGRWRRITIVVLVVGLVALIPLLRTPRFANMLNPEQGTTGFRVALWYSSLQMVRDHPILGVGPDNFLYAYRSRYVLPTAWEEFNLSHPHNVVLDFATRLGLPGLAIFVWMQVVFWWRVLPLRRADSPQVRALGIGIAASMVDFLAHGMVDASYFVVDLAYVYMLAMGVVAWTSGRNGQEELAAPL